MFFVAESLHMTVDKLLTGKDLPMSNLEFTYWGAYFNEKAALQEKASKGKQSKTAGGQELKKMMGNNQTAM